jgi:carbamoyltransferase
MYILGINGGFRQGYQDVSAVLVKDGVVIVAIEEERLSRIKFSAGKLPYLAVLEVLKIGNITIQDIQVVAFHGSTWQPNFVPKIESYFQQQFGYTPTIQLFHHHDCHIASAYYASGFQKALLISIDGSGDGISIQIATGIDGKIQTIHREERPNSLGIFYSMITQYCGFVRDSDEYKLMGLSSYGNRNAFDFSWLLDFDDGKITISQDYLVKVEALQPSPHRDEMLFNELLEDRLGQNRRKPNSLMIKFYEDVAASAQQHFEQILLKMAAYYIANTGLTKVCMAGGAALNCVANQKLMNADFVEELYIQPASSDAGISLGAAWLACIENNIRPMATKHTYLGKEFTNEDIESILLACKIKFQKINNTPQLAAQYIAANKVIGWFQGKMEFGPRALGNRSILANPCHPKMQQIVNEKIKLREGFRPFCPSVIEEDIDLYFEGKQKIAPYMTITFEATEYAKENIPSVIHVDGTARIQTVSRQKNKIYYSLLLEMKQLTGHGVVLNTSFNLSHEPIVCTPRDALATFFSSGLDALFLGDFLVEK